MKKSLRKKIFFNTITIFILTGVFLGTFSYIKLSSNHIVYYETIGSTHAIYFQTNYQDFLKVLEILEKLDVESAIKDPIVQKLQEHLEYILLWLILRLHIIIFTIEKDLQLVLICRVID